MSLIELFIIAVGLSMDAFAVSICKGLSIKKFSIKSAFTVGMYFGVFQGLMPLIGFLVGSRFSHAIEAYDHWIAFVLLGIIGGKMVKEGMEKCDIDSLQDDSLTPKNMLPLSVATSIDALAVGVSFAFLNVNITPAVIFIGTITFSLSMLGVKIGNIFGLKYKSKAEIAGGVVLIFMGIKILIEHLGII